MVRSQFTPIGCGKVVSIHNLLTALIEIDVKIYRNFKKNTNSNIELNK